MINKEKFLVVTNNVKDWKVFAFVDPDRLVPESMLPFFPGKEAPVKVTEVCWSRELQGKTFIRLGSLGPNGTLISEQELDNWLDCLEEGEEELLLTFDDYKELVRSIQTDEI